MKKKKNTKPAAGKAGRSSSKSRTLKESGKSRGFLQRLKARYPHLYEVMYRRVDSQRYLEFESFLEEKQDRIRKGGAE